MGNNNKILKGSKRIVLEDKDYEDVYRWSSNLRIEEYKKKHFWSLRYSWVVIESCFGDSDDYNCFLQNSLVSNLESYPEAEFINLSNRIHFNPDMCKRKILVEKYVKYNRLKNYYRSKRTMKAVYLGENEQRKGGDILSYTADNKCVWGNVFTVGKKYVCKFHHSNERRVQGFEKFLIVKNDFGDVGIYPVRLFKIKGYLR